MGRQLGSAGAFRPDRKITVTIYTCRYGSVSLDLSVVVSQTTEPRDIPHRLGSVSEPNKQCLRAIAPQSRGTVTGLQDIAKYKIISSNHPSYI